MEDYSWKTFSVILNDPARLREWLVKTMSQETDTPLDPDDSVVEERGRPILWPERIPRRCGLPLTSIPRRMHQRRLPL